MPVFVLKWSCSVHVICFFNWNPDKKKIISVVEKTSSPRGPFSSCNSLWIFIHSIVCIFLFIFPAASREGTTCSFADPAFVVYSSVASFYVPFIVTLLVYAQICVVLRKRGRRTAPPHRHGLHSQGGAEAGEGHRHRKVDSQIWTSPESNCFWFIFERLHIFSLFSPANILLYSSRVHKSLSERFPSCHILKNHDTTSDTSAPSNILYRLLPALH